MPQGAQATMYPHARRLRCRAEHARHVVVLELVDDPEPDSVELAVRQVLERLVEALEPGLVRLGGHGLGEEAETLARVPLQAVATHRADEHVARDGEEPRAGGAAEPVPEPGAGEPRL